jgi:hypothetical protein
MMETMGMTFDVKRIETTIKQIEMLKNSRRDYIWPAEKLSVQRGQLFLKGKVFEVKGGSRPLNFTTWEDAEQAADAIGGTIAVQQSGGALPMSRNALGQLCAKLNVPIKFLDYLHQNEHGELADHNLTKLLGTYPKKFFLRTVAAQPTIIDEDSATNGANSGPTEK